MKIPLAFNFFVPRIIEKVYSPINGKIQVVKLLGETRIVVNKMLQSGGLVELIWKKGINKISNYKLLISNVLILGLGGGSAAKIINKKFPQAKITGIEIDPIMIKLGKKYFGLGEIKNLKIINIDAIKFVNNISLYCLDLPSRHLEQSERSSECNERKLRRFAPRFLSLDYARDRNDKEQSFNLILVDLYLGDLIPKKSHSRSFLRDLKKILSPTGEIIINCLFYGEHKVEAEKVVKEVAKIFAKVNLVRAWSNLLVVCQG